MSMLRSSLVLALAVVLAVPAAAQAPARAHLQWRTVSTQHFDVHYPAEMSAWALDMAARLDAVHAEVTALIGHTPARRVDVLVEDPYNISNGFAMPALAAPTIVLWPTPPEPGMGIGHLRGWGELLAVHEFAHIAHLVRPTRNPRQRLLWSLLPVNVGPVSRRAPRWVSEGYATYVEGRLTGSGRPHGVARPAILRQWALEGRLPTYAQLSGWGDFQGMGMAYMVGSAFLEWLAAERGEESLQHLWRRMSARQSRGFDEAFAGVFGGYPAELYGRFTVDVTERALAARALLEAAGLEQGDTVQALSWTTGAPAVSPDGQHLAIVLRSRTQPARVVVWPTAEEPEDTLAETRRRRLLERDPEDVPAVQWRPRPRRALATLPAVAGRAHDQPRFLPGGRELLVTRFEPRGDGTLRPDLFVWTWETGALRRVTRGAGIRTADPMPDGRAALGVRCLDGRCDLVRVELADGAVSVLQPGTPGRTWYRPRVSPDGARAVAALQESGVWRLVLVSLPDGAVREISIADGASRYDADWLPDGRRLVAVSERGGVADAEVIDVETGAARPITRVTGAVAAPAPSPADGSVYFLRLHSRGLDLQRVHPDSVDLGAAVPLPAALWPVAPPPAAPGARLEPAPLPAPRAYGLGPRSYRLLPGGGGTPEGGHFALMLASTDPVGRLGWLLQGALGEPGSWSGASLRAEYRGLRPALGGDLFLARHRPSRGPAEGYLPAGLDADYAGALLHAAFEQDWARWRHRLRAGGSAGLLDPEAGERAGRVFGFADYRLDWSGGAPQRRLALSLALDGAAGRTGGEGWARARASAGLGARVFGLQPRLDATYGALLDSAAPVYERFAVGGAQPPLFDAAVLPQRLAMPAVPFGVRSGTRLLAGRAALAVGPLTPYLWAASTDAGFSEWFRVAGVEARLDMGTAPLVRLPGIELVGGVGHALDAPVRGEWGLYFTARYRP